MTSAVGHDSATPAGEEHRSSLWGDAWHRLARNKLAVFGGMVVVIFALMCVTLPWFFDLSYQAQGLEIGGLPPGSKVVKIYQEHDPKQIIEVSDLKHLAEKGPLANRPDGGELLARLARAGEARIDGRIYRTSIYLLGADAPLGRDLFARILYGGGISLGVGLCATFVALVIGVTYGAVSGFFGGKTDIVMMRIVDIMYALPFTIFVILLMVYFGRNIVLLFVAIGAVEWLTMARIVRGQVLTVKRMEYIEAAHALGYGKRRIIFRHMIPNVLGPIIVYTTLTIPAVMLLEAFLSFLGLGVQDPMSSWGKLIRDGAEKMEEFHWLLIYPGAVFSLTLFSLNFLGDGLRDALDVRAAKD